MKDLSCCQCIGDFSLPWWLVVLRPVDVIWIIAAASIGPCSGQV